MNLIQKLEQQNKDNEESILEYERGIKACQAAIRFNNDWLIEMEAKRLVSNDRADELLMDAGERQYEEEANEK
jgi:hypothetical protein